MALLMMVEGSLPGGQGIISRMGFSGHLARAIPTFRKEIAAAIITVAARILFPIENLLVKKLEAFKPLPAMNRSIEADVIGVKGKQAVARLSSPHQGFPESPV